LQVINSSPGDLAPVFDAMLERATRLCETTYGQLATYDGEFFRFVAVHGDSPFVEEQQVRGLLPPSFGVTWPRIVRGERVVHIADLVDTDLYRAGHEGARRGADIGGARTLLSIALRKEGVLLGVLTIYRQEVRPFTDKQIALVKNFAAQAVIAMENARLLTETREALEQQTATAEVLQVINNSPGDLAPVFDAILEKAHSLCGVATGSLQLYDGEKFRAAAVRGMSEAMAERLRQGYTPGPNMLNRRLLDGDRVAHILDLAEIDDPMARTIVEQGYRTLLCVALRKDDCLLGQIVAARRKVCPFSDKEIVLLQNFAAQAVIAMENARLLGELRERTGDLQESLEYQTATSDVLKVISRSTFDLQPVLDTVVETAARLCQAQIAGIAIHRGDAFHYVATKATRPEFDAWVRARPFRPGRDTMTGRVALEGRVIQVADTTADPEYEVPEVFTLGGIRTLLGMPLLREGEAIGVISLARQAVEPFSERQIELVRTFADQAVIAIENARLLDELQKRTEEVDELNRGLEARVAEQVEELGRVGRLKRFLAPQLAELIVSQGDEKILESHRREIVVVFCDLRGYTAFTETAEPEEVLDFLREYHGKLGPLVSQFEGTLDQFSGDGIMVFFNDPVPIPNPAECAVKMAVVMREAAGQLIAAWHERGRDLGFGAGIDQGYATLGQIGFSERSGYTAIGTVCNVAARLCGEAKDGQILLSQRVNVALKRSVATEQVGALALKGLSQPVVAYNVPLVVSQAAFRVIEGGAPSA
jgi:adenylate cyclase